MCPMLSLPGQDVAAQTWTLMTKAPQILVTPDLALSSVITYPSGLPHRWFLQVNTGMGSSSPLSLASTAACPLWGPAVTGVHADSQVLTTACGPGFSPTYSHWSVHLGSSIFSLSSYISTHTPLISGTGLCCHVPGIRLRSHRTAHRQTEPPELLVNLQLAPTISAYSGLHHDMHLCSGPLTLPGHWKWTLSVCTPWDLPPLPTAPVPSSWNWKHHWRLQESGSLCRARSAHQRPWLSMPWTSVAWAKETLPPRPRATALPHIRARSQTAPESLHPQVNIFPYYSHSINSERDDCLFKCTDICAWL